MGFQQDTLHSYCNCKTGTDGENIDLTAYMLAYQSNN